jgi:hypothetical protein
MEQRRECRYAHVLLLMTWVAGQERPAAFCVPSKKITTSREATEMLRPVDPPLCSIGHTRLLSSVHQLKLKYGMKGYE